MKGFYIFCDESIKKGKFYSNFYGGVLIDKDDFDKINNVLLSKKQDLKLEDAELKWSYVNTFKVEQYKEIMDVFFEFVSQGLIKVRIMFTDNRFVPINLTKEQKHNQYHILYYHFVKHAFGFCNFYSDYQILTEIFFDKIPDNETQNKKFRDFIYGLQYLPEWADSNIIIRKESIYEVHSHHHVFMECLDVVLGSMAFRLNDLHKEKPIGSRKRGNRTIAKELLYKHVNKKIRAIMPNFNIGITTGIRGAYENRFLHPYRHWLFTPSEKKIM